MNDTKSYLIRQILASAAPDYNSDQIKRIKRELLDKPTVYIGTGTCGLGAGAAKTKAAVQSYLYEHKIEADIIETGCIGLCSAEPIMDLQLPGKNRISFENVNAEDVSPILDKLFAGKTPEKKILGQFRTENSSPWKGAGSLFDSAFFKPQKRIVLKNCGIIDPVSIDEYIATGGYKGFLNTVKKQNSAELCKMILDSGLRGRGGGGFPTGKKWTFALNTPAEQKYLICNADEGDPGAFMDRAIIEGDPHRLIEGMAIAAYAIGASKSYVYIRAEYPLAIKRLRIALDQARDYGLLGENIFDTGTDFDIKIKTGAGAFVCGEETALIHSIEGKRGMPRPRPPYPAVSGLFGKPTIINNVETLANLPEIVSKGKDWFVSFGTKNSTGTKVFALSGKIALTGLIEIPMGTGIREVIFDIAGGIPNGKKFKSVQIGGPSGGCITEENLDIPIDYDSLLEVGAMMGSGGLVVMDEDTCMVDVAKFFMDFIRRESCGKCIPCREGTRRMLEILEDITKRPHGGQEHEALRRFKGVAQLEQLGKVIQETSLCGLGQSAPNPVLSTLRWFRSEYEEHIFERVCSAQVCTELRTFYIEPEKCTGCTICARKCPTDAIIGTRKAPHFVIDEKCIACGTCVEVCKFDAITVS